MRKTTKTLLSVATTLVLATGFAPKAEAAAYQVQPGDTLWIVANKFDTTIANLKSINKLSSDMLYVNQVLETEKTTTSTTYTVQSGDTLWIVANKFGTTIANLMEWNNKSTYNLSIGERLIVSETNTDTTSPTKITAYKVSAGDSLFFIAQRYGVSVANIKAWNNLSSNTIYAGQVLQLTGATISSNDVTVGSKVVTEAKKHIGTPYVWGGTKPGGFDCSGFIYYAHNQAGQSLRRTSTTGYYSMTTAISNPKPGDLVFFSGTYRSGISHMGIYVGNNSFIHASSSKGVSISSLDNVYWSQHSPEFRRWK